jgi:hypothetical protein
MESVYCEVRTESLNAEFNSESDNSSFIVITETTKS